MRISKLWSAVCAAAFLAGFLSVRAQDNPAQAAARAALMGKMSGLNAQPTQPAHPNLAPIVITPAGAAAQQPGQPARPGSIALGSTAGSSKRERHPGPDRRACGVDGKAE